MIKQIIALCCCLVVIACSVTKQMTANSLPRHNQMTFGLFGGKQHYKMPLFGVDTLSQFHYRFVIDQGEIQMKIKQEGKTILDLEHIKSLNDTLLLKSKDGATIDIFLQGKQAKGSYDLTITKVD